MSVEFKGSVIDYTFYGGYRVPLSDAKVMRVEIELMVDQDDALGLIKFLGMIDDKSYKKPGYFTLRWQDKESEKALPPQTGFYDAQGRPRKVNPIP